MPSRFLHVVVPSMLLLALGVPTPRPLAAATLSVTDFGDSGAPGQLRTLINAAAPGDTIVVPAGTITLSGPAGTSTSARISRFWARALA